MSLHFEERITVTIPHALKAVGLGRTKLYELINNGEVETVRVGRRRLVVVKSLLELLGQRRNKTFDDTLANWRPQP